MRVFSRQQRRALLCRLEGHPHPVSREKEGWGGLVCISSSITLSSQADRLRVRRVTHRGQAFGPADAFMATHVRTDKRKEKAAAAWGAPTTAAALQPVFLAWLKAGGPFPWADSTAAPVDLEPLQPQLQSMIERGFLVTNACPAVRHATWTPTGMLIGCAGWYADRLCSSRIECKAPAFAWQTVVRPGR